MATKYQRKEAAERISPNARRILELRQSRRTIPIRRRLLLTYMGLLFFGVLALALHVISSNRAEREARPQRSVGCIVEKETHKAVPAYWFKIAIPLPSGKLGLASTPVEKEQWDRFSTGDYLGVLFTGPTQSGKITIIELGLVALSKPDL